MSKSQPHPTDEWADNPLRNLSAETDEQHAYGRLQGWISRREFRYAERPPRQFSVVARVAAAAIVVLIIAGFAVFNFQHLPSRRTSPAATPAATPSVAPTTAPTASPSTSPLPTSRVATPGPLAPPPAGSWQSVSNMSVARAHFTGLLLPDGKVLIVGGVSDNTVAGSATAVVEIYDPATKKFAPAASLSIGRAGHTATLLRDGRVLVAGGYTQLGTRALGSVEIYDPSTDQWSAAAPMNHARTDHAAVLLADGRVLVVGGAGSPSLGIGPHGAAPATIPPEVYDPATDTWTTVALQTYDRPVDPTATLLKDGRVLVVGGQNMFNSPDEDVERSEVYDVATDTWSGVRPDLRFAARQFHSATLLPDGKVLVAGGEIDTQPIATAALYDPSTNSWIELPHMAQTRCGQGAVLLPTGRVLVSGSGCWTSFSAGAEEFDPGTNRWYRVADMHTARGTGAAVALLDGSVVMAGGLSSNVPVPAVEVFRST